MIKDFVGGKFQTFSNTIKKPYLYAIEFIEALKAEQAKEREFQEKESMKKTPDWEFFNLKNQYYAI